MELLSQPSSWRCTKQEDSATSTEEEPSRSFSTTSMLSFQCSFFKEFSGSTTASDFYIRCMCNDNHLCKNDLGNGRILIFYLLEADICNKSDTIIFLWSKFCPRIPKKYYFPARTRITSSLRLSLIQKTHFQTRRKYSL